MSANDSSSRLRQAILLNDLPLVKRILDANPPLLYNPLYSDKADTSLHLAASLGLEAIARHLIKLGHDTTTPPTNDICGNSSLNQGVSINTDGQTPLHLAARNLHTSVVELLCISFPATVNRTDNKGRSSLLLAACAQPKPIATISVERDVKFTTRPAEDISTILTLLEHKADVGAQDLQGNTCLHNACAFGNLKALRALIEAGADPARVNYAGWKAEYYSLTVQAEVYYKTVVTEISKRKAEEHQAKVERRGRGGGAVRLVAQDDEDSDSARSPTGRSRADSGRSHSTFESAMS